MTRVAICEDFPLALTNEPNPWLELGFHAFKINPRADCVGVAGVHCFWLSRVCHVTGVYIGTGG